MRLAEPCGSVDLTDVIAYGTATHLAVAPKVQEHIEMREGPDKVCNIIRLGGLERSTPRVQLIASPPDAPVGGFPFVFL